MSDELIQDLTINVHWRDIASGPARQFHDAEEQRIRKTQQEQDKADQAYIRAMKLKLRAEKQLEDEKERAARKQEREQQKEEADYVRAVKAKLRAEDQLEQQKERALRKQEREQERADRAYVRATMQRLRAEKDLEEGRRREIERSRDEVAGLLKTYMGFQAVRGLAQSIGDEFKRANEFVRETAEKFAEVRQALQQVAGLRGEQNSNRFALGQIDKAAEGGFTPDEWRRAQEAFLNPAGAHVGDHAGAKMSNAEAEAYEMRVARRARSKGVDPALAMEFAGSILEQSRGHLTPDQAMARFNPAFEVLEKGRVDLGRAMPMMSQLMSHGGMTPAEAATLFSVVAPASPGQEAVGVEGAFRALEEMRVTGKGAAFGVTNKMSKYGALKAFAQNIRGREQALRAAGKTDEEIEVEIARQLKAADVAGEIRERRGLVRGIVRQGLDLGGFRTFEGVAARAGADADIAAVREYERSDAGRASRRRATIEIERARAGYHEQGVKAELEKAEAEAIRERQFSRSRSDMIFRGGVGAFTGVGAEDQIKNEIALRNLRLRAYYTYGITGDRQGAFQKDSQYGIATHDVQYRSQESINAEIRDLLKLLVEAEHRKERERDQRGMRPLVNAHPAMPGGAR